MEVGDIRFEVVEHNPHLWCVYSYVVAQQWALGHLLEVKNYVASATTEQEANLIVEMLKLSLWR